jgi:hypothetical protein
MASEMKVMNPDIRTVFDQKITSLVNQMDEQLRTQRESLRDSNYCGKVNALLKLSGHQTAYKERGPLGSINSDTLKFIYFVNQMHWDGNHLDKVGWELYHHLEEFKTFDELEKIKNLLKFFASGSGFYEQVKTLFNAYHEAPQEIEDMYQSAGSLANQNEMKAYSQLYIDLRADRGHSEATREVLEIFEKYKAIDARLLAQDWLNGRQLASADTYQFIGEAYRKYGQQGFEFTKLFIEHQNNNKGMDDVALIQKIKHLALGWCVNIQNFVLEIKIQLVKGEDEGAKKQTSDVHGRCFDESESTPDEAASARDPAERTCQKSNEKIP